MTPKPQANTLDEIAGKHSIHWNYSKAETLVKIQSLITEARIDELMKFNEDVEDDPCVCSHVNGLIDNRLTQLKERKHYYANSESHDVLCWCIDDNCGICGDGGHSAFACPNQQLKEKL